MFHVYQFQCTDLKEKPLDQFKLYTNLCARPLHLYGWAESGLIFIASSQSLIAAFGFCMRMKQLQRLPTKWISR